MMPLPPPLLPTLAEFDALPFVQQVAMMTSVIGYVIAGYQQRLRVRQRDHRGLSDADRRALLAVDMSVRCLLVESRERLTPGSLDASIRDAMAALVAASPDGAA